MTRRRCSSLRRMSGLAALCLMTSACGSDPEPGPADRPASTASDSNDQAQAKAPAAPQTAPILTADGFGPLRIGMTLADVVTTYGPDSDPGSVGGPEPESCDQFRPARAPADLLVMIEEGRLTRISLLSGSEVKTDRGLHLGLSGAQIRAAYGPELRAEPHKYADPPAEYLTVWTRGGPGADGIASEGSRGIRYEIGSDGNVATIHTGGDSIQYVEGCL